MLFDAGVTVTVGVVLPEVVTVTADDVPEAVA
jgi:hypothetical protein